MYEDLKTKIKNCDMVLVGFGNLASLYPTYDYNKNYSFSEQCDIFSSVNQGYMEELMKMYDDLAAMLEKKNYFILTTISDGLIKRSSLNPIRIAALCGSKDRLQCGCNTSESIIDTPDGYYLNNNILKCPVCGQNYIPNIYNKTFYNENGYLKQWNLYNKWLQGTLNKNLVIIEIGCDFSLASLIRWPFEKIALINQKAFYYRVNNLFPQITAELKERMFSIEDDPCTFVRTLSSL